MTLVPARPSGFDGTVSPGESLTATFDAGESGATDPRRMCGQEVAVIFRWIDRRVGDDLTMMMLGAAESSTTDVTCE